MDAGSESFVRMNQYYIVDKLEILAYLPLVVNGFGVFRLFSSFPVCFAGLMLLFRLLIDNCTCLRINRCWLFLSGFSGAPVL